MKNSMTRMMALPRGNSFHSFQLVSIVSIGSFGKNNFTLITSSSSAIILDDSQCKLIIK
jgi:hypothetical protein